jgi:SAM-dependent methyltransferase
MTDWEARYQQGDTPWDKGAAHPALVDYLKETPLAGRVLAVGSGLGYDVRAIAAATPDAHVTGIDLAPSAIRAAESFPKSRDERYLLADLFALPQALRGCFDWVWEHTCFCAIDPSARPAYLRGLLEALKPEGHFLAVFYLDPGDEGGPPFGVEIAELDALFGRDFELLEDWMPTATYPGREGRERMRLLRRKPPSA